MSSPTTVLIWIALAWAVGLTSCSRSPGASTRGQATENRGAVPVTVAVAKEQDVPVQLQAIGTVRASASVSIKARVDGELARVAFRQGDEVRKGELIFQLDPRSFQAALDQAEGLLERDLASLENARRDRERTDALAGTKAVAATDVDANRAKVASLQATVAADRAAIEGAKLNLSFCSITAPVTGRIGLLLVDEGNMVKNNDTVLAIINQMRPIYVDFSVPERSLLAVREAAGAGRVAVTATIPQRPDRRAAGELAVINNQVDSSTGMLPLRAVFPNRDELLWPGQFVNVVATLATEHNAVVVPSIAIQLGQAGQYVWVVNPDDTVAPAAIQAGATEGGFCVIKQGLRAGQRVVTSGGLRLVAGTKVRIVRAGTGARPPETVTD